jgi:hypothetical protein
MDIVCEKCGALAWIGEIDKSSNSAAMGISICCMKGKVSIPYLKKPPTLLWNLINGYDQRSAHFRKYIRSYNSMFAFTSLGGNIETNSNDGVGPPQFVLSGQNYHRIGSLLPREETHRPKFAQLYIYDTRNEVANRLSHFRFVACIFEIDFNY